MRYIGIIPADRLPSSSIGLRAMEFERMKFARTIAYTTARATVVRQYHGIEVAKSIEDLRKMVEKEPDGTLVYVNGHSKIDSDTMKVIGVPGDNEVRCIAGKLFSGSTPIGDKSLVKVMEYDRRRNVFRYMKGDAGDIMVDVADLRGPVAMNMKCLRRMLSSGRDWTKTIGEFQDTIDTAGATVICMDPMKHGVRWHSGLVQGEKKPTSVVVRNSVKTVEEAPADASRVPAASQTRYEGGLPVLPVVFLTHNRTRVACYCLDALCKRLKYDGRIHYVICDDRSDPSHVDSLENVLRGNGVLEYSVERTTTARWGIGASMNNGLARSFSMSCLALTTEDDFLLEKEFDITGMVRIAMSDEVAGIRLASVYTNKDRTGTTPTAVSDFGYRNGVEFLRVTGGTRPNLGNHYTFNNQVMLRNRRVYDFIGLYDENVKPELVETRMCRKYSVKCEDGRKRGYAVLYPKNLPLNTLNNGLFIHIGRSTLGHKCDVVNGYEWLNEEPAPKDDDASTQNDGRQFYFHVVTPFYNCSEKLARCLDSVSSQQFPMSSVRMTVVDDASDMEESRKAEALCSRYDFVKFIRNSRRTMAGGARNTALRCGRGRNCLYTVFLDADDVLIDDSSFKRLWSTIEANGMPDVVLCGFVFNKSGKKRMFTASSPSEMAKEMAIAPWIRVTKTDKVAEFVENRRVANDVVQFLRQIEAANTVASMDSTFIRYMDDNDLSAWNGSARKSNETTFALCMVAPDILSENFTKPYVKERAQKMMMNHAKLALARLERVVL